MNGNSLRRSLLRWLLLPLLPILFVGAAVSFHFSWRATEDTFDLSLLDAALDLSHQMREVAGAPALELPAVAQQMLASSNEDRVMYVVKNDSGRIISGETSLPLNTIPGSESNHQFYDAEMDGVPVRVIALRRELKSGAVHIAVAQTIKARDRMFGRILLSQFLPEVLLVVASLIAVWFGVGRGLAPAERLRSEIVSRSPQDMRPIEESSAPTELRPILHAVNELLSRLDLALGSQRQFIADAAHQLRTPLAVLRAQIEVALTRPAEPHQATLQELLAVTERTTRLANQLLSLARAEHVQMSGELGDMVDLKHLVTDIAGDWVVRAARNDMEISFEIAPVAVSGNEFLIREMLANLLDNAVRYTPAHGNITLRVATSGSGAIIQVEDSGPGIAPKDRDRVLQRFVRLASGKTEGCGLGLAIVDQIARAHGASLDLSEPASGTGLVVTVTFPQQPMSMT